MPSVVRLGDSCSGHGSHPARTCIEASDDVFVNGKPVHRVGDAWETHTDGNDTHGATTIQGSPNVFVNGKPVAFVGGGLSCGSVAAEGSPDVFVNEARPYEVDPVTGEMPECAVERIPKTMRALGWERAAKLMERWFAGLVSNDKNETSPDVTTIDMDWLLSFEEIAEKHDTLMDPSFYTSEKSKCSLAKVLRDNGQLPETGAQPFNDIDDVRGTQKNHFQFAASGLIDALPPVDELYATIGAYSIYLTAIGQVEKIGPTSYEVTVTELAVTFKDNYDFEGEQSLGVWDFDNDEFNYFFPGCPISNDSFQQWRTSTGHGRDFYIYAGVKRASIPSYSFSFDLTTLDWWCAINGV